MKELYKLYRPKRFTDIVGQPETVLMLTRMVKTNKVPQTILFSGASGTGKTTLARILAKKLNCSSTDLTEINIADFRKIETVRGIRKKMTLSPLRGGSSRVWILDEVQNLLHAGQEAFLKILEDTPPNVYFFLATTAPQKLLKTLRNRCTEIQTKPLNFDDMETLITITCQKEDKKINNDVTNKIIEVADGSARKALVILNQVLELTKENDQLEVIRSSDEERQAIEIAKALLQHNPSWKAVAKLIKEVDEEPESIRRLVLAYASGAALKSGMPKAIAIIEAFSGNYYDSGRAGLIWSAWHCCQKPPNRR